MYIGVDAICFPNGAAIFKHTGWLRKLLTSIFHSLNLYDDFDVLGVPYLALLLP